MAPISHLHRFQPADRTIQHIARHHGTNTGWRAGHDDVSRHQGVLFGQFCDDLVDLPDQQRDVVILLCLTIDLQLDVAGGHDPGLVDRSDGADGGGLIKGFGDFPRQALFQHTGLMVAAGHVEAHGVAEDMFGRVAYGDVVAAGFHRDDQFAFVVKVLGEHGVGDLSAVADKGIGRLHEDDRRIAFVLLHFAHMGEVVLSDAIDPPDGEFFVRSNDVEIGRIGRRNSVGDHGSIP